MENQDNLTAPPQWTYANEIVGDFIMLSNNLANYRAIVSADTTRALMTSLTSLYMKLRLKVKDKVERTNNSKSKNKPDDKDFNRLLKSMNKYVFGFAEKFEEKELLLNTIELCLFFELTGLTKIETNRINSPTSAIKEKFNI